MLLSYPFSHFYETHFTADARVQETARPEPRAKERPAREKPAPQRTAGE